MVEFYGDELYQVSKEKMVELPHINIGQLVS